MASIRDKDQMIAQNCTMKEIAWILVGHFCSNGECQIYLQSCRTMQERLFSSFAAFLAIKNSAQEFAISQGHSAKNYITFQYDPCWYTM